MNYFDTAKATGTLTSHKGVRIWPTQTQFGTLFAVGDGLRAFATLEAACDAIDEMKPREPKTVLDLIAMRRT